MNGVFAKLKGRRSAPIFKLLSGCSLFAIEPLNTDSCVEYNPDHNLDEDAWFKVEEFSRKPFCLDFLKGGFDSKDYNELERSLFEKILFVFSVQEGDFYFQKITSSMFLRKKSLVFEFGEVVKIEEGKDKIVINSLPDAVYFKKLDMLVFRDFARISGIFEGIDVLYKEATNEEVESLLREPFISLGAGFGAQSVSKPNRKRIALAMDTLASMSSQDRKGLVNYIGYYCSEKLNLDIPSGKFTISNDEELKMLLYGIEQRFYTTPFSKQRRLANSVQNVD